MKVRQAFNSKLFYRLISLFFALLLSFYVTSEKGNTTRSGNSGTFGSSLVSNKTITLETDLKLNVNSDKYFVSGYPDVVKVKISGPSALVIAAKNTQNFEIYADLNDLKPGVHTVRLKDSGLSSELTVKIIPEKITVQISKKKIKKTAVQVRYDSNRIASGYAAGEAYSSQAYVTVTGAAKDINNLDKVVANLNLPRNANETYAKNVALQALDESGKVLNVVISPADVTATVPIYTASASKRVPINLVARGEGVSNMKYSFSSDTKTVTVHGTKEALSKLNRLDVPVSITGVTADTVENVRLSPSQSGITAISPTTITVNVSVSQKEASTAQKQNQASSQAETSSASSTKETVATDDSSSEATSSSSTSSQLSSSSSSDEAEN